MTPSDQIMHQTKHLFPFSIGNDASRVEDNIAMLFFCILFSLFTAMMPTIMTYPSEMKTFKREYSKFLH